MGIFDIGAQRGSGNTQYLGDYRGLVLLIVNTASRCGFTPQYKGLQALQDRFAGQGFSVLGFPCNQFGHQEPGSDDEIRQFCETTYRIDFPLFAKIDVNGPRAHPLFVYLKAQKGGGIFGSAIKWNFTKFLVGRDGKVLDRFPPTATPDSLAPAIAAALAAKPPPA
jgi:glutathione peroxidase